MVNSGLKLGIKWDDVEGSSTMARRSKRNEPQSFIKLLSKPPDFLSLHVQASVHLPVINTSRR